MRARLLAACSRRWSALALLFGIACAQETTFVPLPDQGASVLLSIRDSDGELLLRLFDTAGAARDSLDLGDRTLESIEAYVLSCPAADIPLLGASSCGPGCFVPQPSTSAPEVPAPALRLENGQWLDVRDDERTALSVGVDLEAAQRCPTFSAESFVIFEGSQAEVTLATTLPDGPILLGRSDHTFTTFQDGIVTPYTRLSTSAPSGGATRRGDSIYLLGTGGQIIQVDRHNVLELPNMRTVPSFQSAFLEASLPQESFELFVLTSRGRMQVLDGVNWSHILDVDMPKDASFGRFGLARVGPDEVIAVVPTEVEDVSRLIHFDGSHPADESLPDNDPSIDAPSAVDHGESGTYVGNRSGGLFGHTRDHRYALVHQGPRNRVRLIQAYEEGLYFGGSDGIINYHHPWFGTCPSVHVSAENVDLAVPTPRGLLLVLRKGIGDTARVEQLTSRRNPPRCLDPSLLPDG